MSLSDCTKCWERLCTCGWQYRHWRVEKLIELRKMIDAVIEYKKQNPNADFSVGTRNETEDDTAMTKYINRRGK